MLNERHKQIINFIFFSIRISDYGHLTIYVSQVKVQNKNGDNRCDYSETGMDKYCDPYVKITLSDDESDPQVFTTNTILNTAGFATIDQLFYSKKLRKDKLKIKIEIYDSNVSNVFANDEVMFEQSVNVEGLVKSNTFGKETAKIIAKSFWSPDYERNKQEINNKRSRK